MSGAWITNITNQKPFYAPLPCHEQQVAELEALYETATLGIFLCDANCRFIRVNRHFAAISGIPAAQHIGNLFWDIVPLAFHDALKPAFNRVVARGDAIAGLEIAGTTPTATHTRYWEVSLTPLYSRGGTSVAISGVIEDVTDRKTTAKGRGHAEERLELLLGANLFGVVTATLDGITEANDAFLSTIGYSRQDFLRHAIDWRTITPPEHAAKDLAGVEQLKETGVCPAYEKAYIRKNGRRVPVLTGATLLERTPLRWVAFVIDLTEQTARQEHSSALMQELTHRSKNLIAVISAISHQLAKTSSSLKEFDARFSSRLQALAGIHDITIRNDWRGCAVRELVLSQLAHCDDLLNKRIFLEGKPAALSASACQYVGMAFHELCTNALKYGALSGDDGSVTIRWSSEPAAPAGNLTITWTERGAPPVVAPTREGFGHRVTTEIIAQALDTKVDEGFGSQGYHWSVVVPAAHLLRDPALAELT